MNSNCCSHTASFHGRGGPPAHRRPKPMHLALLPRLHNEGAQDLGGLDHAQSADCKSTRAATSNQKDWCYNWYCEDCGRPAVRSNDREVGTADRIVGFKVRTDPVLQREAKPALTIHNHCAQQTVAH